MVTFVIKEQQMIDKEFELCYVQVHKKRDSEGKIEEISTRIVLGDELKSSIFFIMLVGVRPSTQISLKVAMANIEKIMPDLSEELGVILKKLFFMMHTFAL